MRPTDTKLGVVPTSFHWTHGGQEVFLVGTFTGWKDRIKMEKESDFIFSHVVDLPLGIHSYKFVVDGEWKYCPDQEQISDCNGNINNCISVTQSIVPGKTNNSAIQLFYPFRKNFLTNIIYLFFFHNPHESILVVLKFYFIIY